MKAIYIQHCMHGSWRILPLILFLILLSACSDDEKLPESPIDLKYGVSFKIQSKSETGTRSDASSTSKIESLQVVAFEKAENTTSLHKVFNAIAYQEGYVFDMLKEGTFQLYFIANTSSELKKALESINTPKELEGFLITEDPQTEDELFLMNSGKKYIEVTTKLNEIVKPTTEVISLKRLVARFDFYNKIENFIPTQITFKNRVIKSLFINESMPDKSIQENGLETNEYEVTSQESLFCTLYSYENLFTEPENKISFKLFGIINDKEVSKEIILQNETSPEDFLVKRNHKYIITLNPGDIIVEVEDEEYQFEFNLKVDEWKDEEITNK